MLFVSVETALDQVLERQRRAAERAYPRALNRTAQWMRTRAARYISKSNRVRVGLVKERIFVARATRRKREARVWIGLQPIPAEKLGKFREVRQGARAGKHYFPGGFVATMPSGKTSVFRRKGRARLPIEKVSLELKDVERQLAAVEREGLAQLEVEMNRQVAYVLSK